MICKKEEKMREILFRGKRVDNGEWVEGYLYRLSETNVVKATKSSLKQSDSTQA